MAGKVVLSGQDTSKLPVLNREKTDELLKRCKEGDKEARQELIRCNIRLVLSVVHRFSNRGENPDDLFQVGCVGLIKAIDNFDLSVGVRFSTYAVPMILGEVRRYLRDNNSIRVSRSVRDTAYKAMQAREFLAAKTGREPGVEEIAAHLSLAPEDVVNALEAVMEPVSMYEPVYHDGNDAIFIMDQMGDDKHSEARWNEQIALKDALKSLTSREKKILNMRYFAGRTQMEVAEEIGISQAQVSRLEKSALERIKKQI